MGLGTGQGHVTPMTDSSFSISLQYPDLRVTYEEVLCALRTERLCSGEQTLINTQWHCCLDGICETVLLGAHMCYKASDINVERHTLLESV